MGKEQLIEQIAKAVIDGDQSVAVELTEKALAAGVPSTEILDDGLSAGLREVGDMFSRLEVFLPEMLISAEVMKSALKILEPELLKLVGDKVQSKKTVVIGTIKGDIHDLGKNIVSTMLTVSGFNVVDVGRDVPVDKFIEEAKRNQASIIAVSTLLTTTMPYIKDLLRDLNDLGIRDQFKVIVGGGPVTQAWADEIGADGYGATAYDAVQVAQKLGEVESQEA